MKKRVVKVWKTELKNCFVAPYRYETIQVITYIQEVKWFFNLFTYYKIKQIVPLIDDPFYDGEYSTNRRLSASAKEQYLIAELEILKIKEKTI
jgi:hypothetical protein